MVIIYHAVGLMLRFIEDRLFDGINIRFHPLKIENINAARDAVSMITGGDTKYLVISKASIATKVCMDRLRI